MNLRVVLSGKVKRLEPRIRSESESEQGVQSEGTDAKPCDLPLAEYNQAKLEYEKDVMQAFKEVYDAVVTFRSARKNTNLKFDLQEASRKYVSLASSQYINGVINYLDVLDAQRSYFDAQVELSNAITNEYLALIELYKALGGGWQTEEEAQQTERTQE